MTVEPPGNIAAAAPPEGFAEAHRALLRDSAIQFRMEPAQARVSPPRVDPPMDIMPVLEVLMWMGLAVLAALPDR